ncbi:4-hydroxy-tetrahydrodipicolinate synthase [Candidatus Kuenenbacteria bacterium HGW-Kuenenbacteria-1]|uniref:4-hydroxy-tetrahydrodipicolinate synthase n=1 Tax=Candidatus Kuenenbacteria bacterium HGW-Kuenenbacteria-1 TaxID=2013812 RepID=A0A2N1UMX6_9BACT|nr:MAG: 4-hydroxy-tetrahydrodipicolinate synthase [Candidatus Kuenenbacteria bacterium HGW-Kuenenbacteria-1]
MNRKNLQGVWTALITPFDKNEKIDYVSLEKLIAFQLKAGVKGILINGTTGESPTLEDDEVEKMIKFAKEKINKKCFLMVGTGTNNTKKSIKKTIKATKAGADLILLVNPYYNKPTQKGLYLHFKAIAQSTHLPVIIYNIKGRTAINLETETLLKLAKEVKNIIGVKEASGDLEQIKNVCEKRSKNFIVFSGDDNITNKIINDFGADGVISVASNIVPEKIVEIVNVSLENKKDKSNKLNNDLKELFAILFIETNPIPVKYIASQMGLCKNIFRLPMCPISAKNAEIIGKVLLDLKLI